MNLSHVQGDLDSKVYVLQISTLADTRQHLREGTVRTNRTFQSVISMLIVLLLNLAVKTLLLIVYPELFIFREKNLHFQNKQEANV